MTDGNLVHKACRGDQSAFEEIYNRYAATVYAYARTFSPDPGWAEDISHEVFLSLHRRGSSYDPARPFRPWLLRVVRNVAFDFLRRRMRDPAAKSVAPRSESDGDPLGPSPLSSELAAAVERTLAWLAPEFGEALWLCDVGGLSYEEAADLMGCAPRTIGSRLSRARQLCRERFQPYLRKVDHGV